MYHAVNIKVKFDNEICILDDENSSINLTSGVRIYGKVRPDGRFQPFAEIPDGTLDKYMHCRPVVLKNDWIEEIDYV